MNDRAPLPPGDIDLARLNALWRGTVHETLGIQFTELSADKLSLRMPVDERHVQLYGMLHGGVAVLLAESATSTLAALGADREKEKVFGQEVNHSHLLPAKPGDTLTANAVRIRQGRTTSVLQADVFNQRNELISTGRYTVAIRPRRLST